MNKLIDRLSGIVKGSITEFDRIVFKSIILPVVSVTEAMSFFRVKKNYRLQAMDDELDSSFI